MRTAITTACVVALLAIGAGSAVAGTNPGEHAQGLRNKAEAAYYLRHMSPDVADATRGVYPGMQAAVPPVRPVQVAGSGFDWGDAGIGAGFAALVLLSAAGAAALRRPRPATR